jgi:hypothetical protein
MISSFVSTILSSVSCKSKDHRVIMWHRKNPHDSVDFPAYSCLNYL